MSLCVLEHDGPLQQHEEQKYGTWVVCSRRRTTKFWAFGGGFLFLATNRVEITVPKEFKRRKGKKEDTRAESLHTVELRQPFLCTYYAFKTRCACVVFCLFLF